MSVAGPTIKALRTHGDSIIRKRAEALAKAWKSSVASLLSKQKKSGGSDGASVADSATGISSRVKGKHPFRHLQLFRPSSYFKIIKNMLLVLFLSIEPVYSFSISAGGAGAPADASGFLVPRNGPVNVLTERVRVLNGIGNDISVGCVPAGKPVVYWMSRDQRAQDNWALLYAQQQAIAAGAPLAVCFNLVDTFLGAGLRHFAFMLRGLDEVAAELASLRIPMLLLRGDHADNMAGLVRDHGVGLVVCDYGPLRVGRAWREEVGRAVGALGVPLHEVDAHNVVPVWVASDKQARPRPAGSRRLPPLRCVALHAAPRRASPCRPALDLAGRAGAPPVRIAALRAGRPPRARRLSRPRRRRRRRRSARARCGPRSRGTCRATSSPSRPSPSTPTPGPPRPRRRRRRAPSRRR